VIHIKTDEMASASAYPFTITFSEHKINIPDDGSSNVTFVQQEGRGRGLIAAKQLKRAQYACMYAIKATKRGRLNTDRIPYVMNHERDDHWFIGDGPAAYINDACSPQTIAKLYECKTIKEVHAWSSMYMAEATQCGEELNVAIGGGRDVCVAIAIHDIPEGRALLTSYGPDHWITEVSCDHKAKSVTRMACLAHGMWAGRFPSLGIINEIPGYHQMWGNLAFSLNGCMPRHPFVKKIEQQPLAVALKIIAEDEESTVIHNMWLTQLGLEPGGWARWVEACSDVGLNPKTDPHPGEIDHDDTMMTRLMQIYSKRCCCGKISGKHCKRCSTSYCSVECQRADWPKHKEKCRK